MMTRRSVRFVFLFPLMTSNKVMNSILYSSNFHKPISSCLKSEENYQMSDKYSLKYASNPCNNDENMELIFDELSMLFQGVLFSE